MSSSIKIGGLLVNPAIAFAPMSGVTARPLRRLVKRLNPGAVGLMMTEFVSVESLTRHIKQGIELLRYFEEERPIGAQLFGYDINRLRDAALMVQDAGFDLLDINCGCPAPKIVRKGGGCDLMRQPEHLGKILRMVRSAVSIPLTIKIRSGWDATSINAIDIAKIAEGEGVNAITVHGRTRSQMYKGEADWGLVSRVAESVSIPVLGSGDVVDYTSAEARMGVGWTSGNCTSTKVSGLMIGRGALKNPFIFTELSSTRPSQLKQNPHLVLDVLEGYLSLLQEDFPIAVVLGRFKQLATGMARGHEFRKPMCLAKSTAEIVDIIKQWREHLPKSASNIC